MAKAGKSFELRKVRECTAALLKADSPSSRLGIPPAVRRGLGSVRPGAPVMRDIKG